MRVQTKATIFANKLVALLERAANRDIYDVYFFFQHLFDVNEELVVERTGKPLKEVLLLIKQQLEILPKSYKILDGLGEVLDEKQKTWVKEHLLADLIGILEMKTAFSTDFTSFT
jgi:predicted nucleotidyltransferase component of viral defense system